MAKARDTDLPQHEINQGHFGELDLSFLPDGTAVGDTIRWDGATWVVEQIVDGKVFISAADTTPDYLQDKVEAGTGIEITVVNPGANEKLHIAVSGGGTSGEVLMADGITDPPEPLVSDDGTDWLYEG